MIRDVSIHRKADRHACPHERDFGESEQVSVPDGLLVDVVQAALEESGMAYHEGGSYTIVVGWPKEP